MEREGFSRASTRLLSVSIIALGMAAAVAIAPRRSAEAFALQDAPPRFALVQPDLFSANGGQANAWADFDNDGDLDEFVGFRGRPNRLYRQDHGRFEDVAAAVGLADNVETRAAAWGDYDNDGDLDLFVAFRDKPNRLFRNDGGRFTDVTAASGIGDARKTVGAVWFDIDGDGDL